MRIQQSFRPFFLVMFVIATLSLPVTAQEEETQTLFTNVNVFDGLADRLTNNQLTHLFHIVSPDFR